MQRPPPQDADAAWAGCEVARPPPVSNTAARATALKRLAMIPLARFLPAGSSWIESGLLFASEEAMGESIAFFYKKN